MILFHDGEVIVYKPECTWQWCEHPSLRPLVIYRDAPLRIPNQCPSCLSCIDTTDLADFILGQKKPQRQQALREGDHTYSTQHTI